MLTLTSPAKAEWLLNSYKEATVPGGPLPFTITNGKISFTAPVGSTLVLGSDASINGGGLVPAPDGQPTLDLPVPVTGFTSAPDPVVDGASELTTKIPELNSLGAMVIPPVDNRLTQWTSSVPGAGVESEAFVAFDALMKLPAEPPKSGSKVADVLPEPSTMLLWGWGSVLLYGGLLMLRRRLAS